MGTVPRIAVVGPLTRDVVLFPRQGRREEKPGGVAYYAARALHRLGVAVVSFARLGQGARALLDSVEFEVRPVWSATTTVFRNVYPREDTDYREQFVDAVAEPFSVEDVRGVCGFDAVLLGPLMAADLPAEVVEPIRRGNRVVGLDAQGYLRQVRDGRVQARGWEESRRVLAMVDVLKCNAEEAQAIVGPGSPAEVAVRLATLGPSEVLVTDGSRGSWVYARQQTVRIAAVPVDVVDPTGAGDVYIAGYLARKLGGGSPEECGRFASEVAARQISGGL
jgi:sugar/nucleoside kinase (ribokinase family)